MAVDTQAQIRKLMQKFETLQKINRASWYEWRQAAIEFAKEGTDPMDIVLRAWEIVGHDTAEAYFGMLDITRETFLEDLAGCIVYSSLMMGESARIENSEKEGEVFVVWDRCPWPEFARRYGASMEEDVLGCDQWFKTCIADVNKLFNTNIKLETLKAIPRGDGTCVRRIWKADKDEA